MSSGITGDLIWQAGSHFTDGSSSWDDGYAVFPDGAVYPMQKAAAQAVIARG